ARRSDTRGWSPARRAWDQHKPPAGAATGPQERPPTRPDSAPRPAWPHPERLGHSRILGVMGEVAMGIVYEAEHESLQKPVALKVMHERLRPHASYLERF